MFSLFKKPQKLPRLQELSLESYQVNYSLDRLVPGVDNIRYDVQLSPAFHKTSRKIALKLIAKHAQAETILGMNKKAGWIKEKTEFERLFQEVMQDAVNKAKLSSETQIDLLAQTAVVKMLIEEIRAQFTILVERFNIVIRKYDISRHNDTTATIKMKEKLSSIQKQRSLILRNVGLELFQCLIDVQQKNLREMREANFGPEAIPPDDLLANPILQAANPHDDFFMIEEYVLLGHRLEDPDKYDPLLFVVKQLFSIVDKNANKAFEYVEQEFTDYLPQDTDTHENQAASTSSQIDSWIKHVDNINILFNYPQTVNQYKRLKKTKGSRKQAQVLKQRAAEQKTLLNLFYKKFQKTGLINRIVASFEMQPIYQAYYPPLVPQQVLQFLIAPKARKSIINQLKRLRGYYGKNFSLTPLRKKIKQIKRIKTHKKKEYLLRFLHGFARYHRDFENYKLLKNGMEHVNLATSEKIINLSRANHTLYEFLLPHERVFEENPVINHVIIKADVRGSTDITHQMKARGLNPASYFSLNFFDPISEILAEYGAIKVFIEGDAIILSILERGGTPGEWYSVARACGFAINMLFIIHRYNSKSHKYKLPILELGTGISYLDGPPTFLFDGDNRIMISPAINQADRLSSCAKPIRKMLTERDNPFNLYVFQTASDKDISATKDDLFLRYNVNGIQLNNSGFAKLRKEIDLREIDCDAKEFGDEPFKIYTGKFPTVSGKYQRLVIREASIVQVKPKSFDMISPTARKYYEVCTNNQLYDYVRKKI